MGKEKTPLCLILGGGGHSRVVIDCLKTSHIAAPYAALDSNPSLWGKELLGVPIRGGDELLPELVREGVTHFIVGVGSVGDSNPRRRLFEFGVSYGLIPLTVSHPSAVCSAWSRVGAGSVLFPKSVVNAGAVLGSNVIINTGAIVEHDCVVGDHVHVATGARLCSTVRVGEGAHIGAGSTVLQCISIGESAVIGAGAVVVKDVSPRTIVVGVPAQPVSEEKGLRSLI